MKKIFDKLFSETSDTSVMRVMSIMSLIAGIVLACIGKNADVISIFIYAAFGGKAVQRYFEGKESIPQVSDQQKEEQPKL